MLHAIVRVDKHTGEGAVQVRSGIDSPMSVITVSESAKDCSDAKPCDVLNGGCEEVCLTRNGQCSCSKDKIQVESDPSRCVSMHFSCPFPSVQFQCSDAEFCVPYNLTCDGIEHCLDGSDENERYCAFRTCKSGYTKCLGNRCIETEKKCDGVDDCGDDEVGCGCRNGGMFKCKSGQKCVEAAKRCDGHPDCHDYSDEIGCSPRPCPPDMTDPIHCNVTTACVIKPWICDGKNDCWDNEDERNCPQVKADSFPSEGGSNNWCEHLGLFACRGGSCIPRASLCDGEDDCHDGSDELEPADEADCAGVKCEEGYFMCLSGECIKDSWVCDSIVDCEDGSDESFQQCPNKRIKTESCDGDKEFLCGEKCAPKSWMCDGEIDCPGQIDEKSCDPVQCDRREFKCLNG